MIVFKIFVKIRGAKQRPKGMTMYIQEFLSPEKF